VLESNNGGDTVLHISALKGNAEMTRVSVTAAYSTVTVINKKLDCFRQDR